MATTFKALVYADNKRKDGTYNVKIRVTHNRRTLKVSTNLYVTAADLTRGLKIKNEEVLHSTNLLIQKWRGIVNRLDAAADAMTVEQIVAHLKEVSRGGDVFRLDFIAYARQVAERKQQGTRRTYTAAINCLERFTHGRPLDVSKVTAKFLTEFEAFIRAEAVHRYSPRDGIVPSVRTKSEGRAASLYLANIRHIHNEAKREYNDEDAGVIRIPGSPFKRYEVKRAPAPRKRAVTVETIQAIIDLPDYERTDGSINCFTRRDMARDCFLMSFALAGMNAADLYHCPAQQVDDVILYNRKKTSSRRRDGAEMRIRIEPCIAQLVDKYRDPSGVRLFCFYKHYSSVDAFNVALRYGLLQIEKAIKAQHFTFYSARHSYATISRSSVLNIDKYTIHEGLNHVDADMRVTDSYIERDFGNIWAANVRLLGLFKWDKLFDREMLR